MARSCQSPSPSTRRSSTEWYFSSAALWVMVTSVMLSLAACLQSRRLRWSFPSTLVISRECPSMCRVRRCALWQLGSKVASGAPVQMLLNVYAGCVGTLIQDPELWVVEEKPCHAHALLLTCKPAPTPLGRPALSLHEPAHSTMIKRTAAAIEQDSTCAPAPWIMRYSSGMEVELHLRRGSPPTLPERSSRPLCRPDTAAGPQASGHPAGRPGPAAVLHCRPHPPWQLLLRS